MRSIYYPPANRTAQWFGPANYTMSGIDKLLLHTTETSGWPGYGGGASAPTLTYHGQRHQWRQHFPLNGSARALRDPSGTVVRENRDNVVQVEIICYCEPGKHPNVTELDAQALDDLGEFAAFLNKEWGTPLVLAPTWLPFPKSYGNSAARMTSAEYDRFRGILATAKRIVGGPPIPKPEPPEEDMPLTPTDAKLVVDELLSRKLDNGTTFGGNITETADRVETIYGRTGVIHNSLVEGGAINRQLDAMHSVLVDEDLQTDRIEDVVQALDVDALADAIVAKMPTGQEITVATVKEGVRQALTEGTGGTP
jgi:hypothetical protein